VYLRKAHVTGALEQLADTVTAIRSFVMPILEALAGGRSFDGTRQPSGLWSR